jgi:hypothetical protein
VILTCIVFNQTVALAPASGKVVCNPGERFLFHRDLAYQVQKIYPDCIYECWDVVLPQPPIVPGSRVLLARPGGGLGDMLMMTGLTHYLRHIGVQIYFACEHYHFPIWIGNPDIVGEPLTMPFHQDGIIRTKGCLPFFDRCTVIERGGDTTSDQEVGNCYDLLFGLIGFTDVPDEFKRPHITLLSEEFGLPPQVAIGQ